MRNTKNTRVYWVIATVILAGFIIGFLKIPYFNYYERGIVNARNVKHVQVGMSIEDLFEIMGKPDTIFDSSNHPIIADNLKVYYYENKPGTSSAIRIHVDSTDNIDKVLVTE